MIWYNPQKSPFVLSGFPYFESDGVYRRLPLNPSCELPEAVYYLADETSGGQIRFHGKFKKLTLRVSLASKPLYFNTKSPHLSRTNKCGFDLYLARGGGEYEFFGVTKDYTGEELYYESTLIDAKEPIEADALINFPLYGAVDKVLLGFDGEAEIREPEKKFRDGKKIVFYGGSIEQGACASRPGMCEANILSRWLSREVYNLGFNSSGKAEESVARVIAELSDVGAFVISTEGNCPNGEYLYENLGKFIEILREAHPRVPIIVMPFVESGAERLIASKGADRREKREAQIRLVEERAASGDENIYLYMRESYADTFEGHSITPDRVVDGLHQTDCGYLETAKGLYKLLKNLV